MQGLTPQLLRPQLVFILIIAIGYGCADGFAGQFDSAYRDTDGAAGGYIGYFDYRAAWQQSDSQYQ